MMRRERAAGINSGSHYTVLFFSAYFIYYAAYCIFSSYTVLFLTERAYSATVCGIITSPDISGKSSDGAGWAVISRTHFFQQGGIFFCLSE